MQRMIASLSNGGKKARLPPFPQPSQQPQLQPCDFDFEWAYWRPQSGWRFRLDMHTLTTLPLLLILSLILVLESLIYIFIRLTGRFVEALGRSPAVRRHLKQLGEVKEFHEYAKWAETMDKLTGRESWKQTDSITSRISGYDSKLIRSKLAQLKEAMQSQSLESVIDVVHSCLVTQMFGTLRPVLYSFTYSGTKALNEELQNQVIRALHLIAETIKRKPEVLEVNPALYSILRRLPKEFGPTSLILSGGAMLGLHHLGMIEVLAERGMIPMIISGTSAGSILAAIVASFTDQELLAFLRSDRCYDNMKDPFIPNSFFSRFVNLIRRGHMMDMNCWLSRARAIFGDMTLLEAHLKTHRILNISMTRAGRAKHPITLNYLNAPNVCLFSATVASACFPFLASPLHLIEKDPVTQNIELSSKFHQMYFHDGSLQGDVPAREIKERWGSPFAVVSQVNLHVFPFLELRAHGTAGLPVRGWSAASVWRGGFPFAACELAVKEHLRFLLRTLALLEIAPAICGIDMAHVALQEYGGDLNIYPKRIYWQHLYVMRNVPPAVYEWYLLTGRRMLFPRLWVWITRHKVEVALREVAHALLFSRDDMQTQRPTKPPIYAFSPPRSANDAATQTRAGKKSDDEDDELISQYRTQKTSGSQRSSSFEDLTEQSSQE